MRRYWGVEGATSQGHALLLFSGQKESTSIIYEILRHARNTIFSKAANHTQPQGKAEKWCIPAVTSDWKLLSRRKKVSANNGTLLLREAGPLQPLRAENLQELHLKLSQQDLEQPWEGVRPTLKGQGLNRNK